MQLGPSCTQRIPVRFSARGWISPAMYETIRAKSVNDDLPQQSLQHESLLSVILYFCRVIAAIEKSIFLTHVRFRFDAYQQYHCVKRPLQDRENIVVASFDRDKSKFSWISTGFLSLAFRASILAATCQVGEDCASRGNHAP